MAAAATTIFLKPSFTSPAPPASSANPIRLHSHRSSRSLPLNPGRCLAAKSGPPESEQNQLTALAGSLSEFQDKVQIFFAVLFWMSLFFWASVWDDRVTGIDQTRGHDLKDELDQGHQDPYGA